MTTKLTDYVLTAEAAGILGVSQNTLRAWAKAGKNSRPPITQPTATDCSERSDLEKFLTKLERPQR